MARKTACEGWEQRTGGDQGLEETASTSLVPGWLGDQAPSTVEEGRREQENRKSKCGAQDRELVCKCVQPP